ncbi:hypothetical protein Q604_UNBC02768G0001, partial [human gut metagenome]
LISTTDLAFIATIYLLIFNYKTPFQ